MAVSTEDDPETTGSAELAGWFLDPADLAPQPRRTGVVTGLTLLVAHPGPAEVDAVESVVATLARDFRVDVVVAASDDVSSIWWPAVRDRLAELGIRHRLVGSGDGPAAALEVLGGAAAGEFAMVLRGAAPDLDPLVPGLLRVWIDGGDALVLADRTSLDGSADTTATDAEVVAGHLVDLLGVGGGPTRGLAVVRRWLVRRLSAELSGVDDPADELRGRLRAVGAVLVELPVDPT
ncbi:MAG: hypothetical protein ACOYOQ_08760 [Microthrixaceae bacterium]